MGLLQLSRPPSWPFTKKPLAMTSNTSSCSSYLPPPISSCHILALAHGTFPFLLWLFAEESLTKQLTTSPKRCSSLIFVKCKDLPLCLGRMSTWSEVDLVPFSLLVSLSCHSSTNRPEQIANLPTASLCLASSTIRSMLRQPRIRHLRRERFRLEIAACPNRRVQRRRAGRCTYQNSR